MEQLEKIVEGSTWGTNFNLLNSNVDKVTKAVSTVEARVKYQPLLVTDFGAIGDGVMRPVSEWLVGAPLSRNYADLAAIQVDYPKVVALTDQIDWAGLQKAADMGFTANQRGYGRRHSVIVPGGCLLQVNRPTLTGHEVALKGDERSSSQIRACENSDFLPGESVIYLSGRFPRNQGYFEHNNKVEKISINAGGRVDYAVSCFNWNENGGVKDAEISQYKLGGIWAEKGTDMAEPLINYMIEDIHMATLYGEDNVFGIKLGGGHNHPVFINRVTIINRNNARGSNLVLPGSKGIWQFGTAGLDTFMFAIHMENQEDGIFIEGGRATIDKVDGWHSVKNTVRFGASAGPSTAKSVRVTSANVNLGGVTVPTKNIVDDGVKTTAGTSLTIPATDTFIDFFDGVYANRRNKGLGNIRTRTAAVTYNALGDGYFSLAHLQPVKPTSWQVTVEQAGTFNIFQVMHVDVTDTHCRFRIFQLFTDGTPPAFRTSGTMICTLVCEL